MYVRKSMIESYSFCPAQFYKTYVLEVPQEETYAMQTGTRFHEFAEWFHDICEGVEPERWHELVPRAFCLYEQSMAAWFLNYEYERYLELGIDHFHPIYRELALISDDLGIGGTIDRIDYDYDEGGYVICEYKTSRSYTKYTTESLMRQFAVYTILFESFTNDHSVIGYRYINPRLGKVVEFDRIEDLSFVVTLVEMIRKASVDPSVCGPTCSMNKFPICGLCSIEESRLFDGVDLPLTLEA